MRARPGLFFPSSASHWCWGFGSTFSKLFGQGKRFVYLLRSERDRGRHYVGRTANIPERLECHNAGQNVHTARNRPWRIVVSYHNTMNQLEQDRKNGDIAKFLHTIQDATAPGHEGFQPWNGGVWPGLPHFVGDNNPFSSNFLRALQVSRQFLRDQGTGDFSQTPARSESCDACIDGAST